MKNKEPLVAISEGLQILKTDRAERVQAHGIPATLLAKAYRLIKKAPDDPELQTILDKVEKALKFYQRDYKTFLLTGTECPNKDLTAVLMLAGFLGYGLLVRYYQAATFDRHDMGGAAIIGLDQCKGLQSLKIQNFVRSHSGEGKPIVLSGSTKEAIESVLEKPLMDYMAPGAMEIKSKAKRPNIPSV
jgi:hypothetical protein